MNRVFTPSIATIRRRQWLRQVSGLAAAVGWAGLATPVTAAAALGAENFYANFLGLQLKDQDGRAIDTRHLSGRITLVNFVYTGCSTTCPVQTYALADLQRQLPQPLRDRVRLLSISLDPLQDTPAALKAYAKRMGADLTGWSFATGRPQDIERVSDALRLFRPDTGVRQPADHSTALWLVDGQGQLRMRYAGNPTDVPRLLREIAALDALPKPIP